MSVYHQMSDAKHGAKMMQYPLLHRLVRGSFDFAAMKSPPTVTHPSFLNRVRGFVFASGPRKAECPLVRGFLSLCRPECTSLGWLVHSTCLSSTAKSLTLRTGSLSGGSVLGAQGLGESLRTFFR